MMIERLQLVLPSLELEAAYHECEADFQLASESVSPQSGVLVARYWIHIHSDGDEQSEGAT